MRPASLRGLLKKSPKHKDLSTFSASGSIIGIMKVSRQFVPQRAFAESTPKTGPSDRVTSFVCQDTVQLSLVQDTRTCLTEELRKREYRDNPNPMAGHCYVASEAIYHKLGGKEAGWTPQTIRHEGGPHWYLKHQNGAVIDPTCDQFETPVPYDQGKGCGFLTKAPSKRSQTVLTRLDTIA